MTGPADFLLTGAGQLVTSDPALGEGPLGLVERGAVAGGGGRGVSAGPEEEVGGMGVGVGGDRPPAPRDRGRPVATPVGAASDLHAVVRSIKASFRPHF